MRLGLSDDGTDRPDSDPVAGRIEVAQMLWFDYLLFLLPGVALSIVGAGPDLAGVCRGLADPGRLGPHRRRDGPAA